jgi:hypothetical protein
VKLFQCNGTTPITTYLVICTIFLGWNLLPLDLLWDLLAFSSHLICQKKKKSVGVGVIRRVGESAGDTDEGSKSELSAKGLIFARQIW